MNCIRNLAKIFKNECFDWKCTSRCFLSTKPQEAFTGGIKMEREIQVFKEDVLPNIMQNRDIKSNKDWSFVREEILKVGKLVTPVNIDSFILNFCLQTHNYDLANSYMEFLKHAGTKPNLSTIGKYFRLFYLTNCDKPIQETDQNHILSLYEELREKHKVLDAVTCENVIYGLSLTEKWRECWKLLEEIKIASCPNPGVCSIVAAAAFRSNENDSAWNILNELVDRGSVPSSIPFLCYLQQFEKSLPAEEFINGQEELFNFFKYNDIKCPLTVAEKINSNYLNSNQKCVKTTINRRGICNNCQKTLQKCEISKEDFENLKNAITENVIIGKNVFCRTTPEELSRFKDFISQQKIYDVVIDGLNVAYSKGTKQSTHILSLLVSRVVKHFVDNNKTVLVLGRTHMNNWPKKNWSYITNNADIFLTHALSQDDPYLLYCALNSGPDTIIVSKDLMRGHLFKLRDPRLKILFNQWLTQSQYQLQYVSNQGKVFFKYPPLYMRTAQKQANCWHIPYMEDDAGTDDKWLCLNP